MAGKVYEFQLARGVHMSMTQQALNEMPAGARMNFGLGFTTAQLTVKEPTPLEAKVLVPPQRKGRRAYNRTVSEEEKFKSTAVPSLPREMIRAVHDKTIKKPTRQSALQRLTSPTSVEPMRSLEMVHGRPQVVCSFDTPLLSKTARRNLARRRIRKERKLTTAVPVETSNSFTVLSDSEETRVSSIARMQQKSQQHSPPQSPRHIKRLDRRYLEQPSIRQRLRSTIELVKHRGLNPYTQRKARDTLAQIHKDTVEQPHVSANLYRPSQTGQYKVKERKWKASTSTQDKTVTIVGSTPPPGRSAPTSYQPKSVYNPKNVYIRKTESRSVAQPQKTAPVFKQSKVWIRKTSPPPLKLKREESSFKKPPTIPEPIILAPASMETSVHWRRRSEVNKDKEKETSTDDKKWLEDNAYQLSDFDDDEDDLMFNDLIAKENIPMVHHVRMVGVGRNDDGEEGEFVEDSCSPRIGLGARAAAAALKQKDEQIALMQRQMLELTKSMSVLMGQSKKPENQGEPSSRHNISSEPNPENLLQLIQQSVQSALAAEKTQHIIRRGRPFPKEYSQVPYPNGFVMPLFRPFNGTGNPRQHMSQYRASCGNAGDSEPLLFKLFVTSLTGIAYEWYADLPNDSFRTFDELEEAFVKRFASVQHRLSIGDLVTEQRRPNESLI